ncbi:MAG: O-phosphoseryl-tRNA(Sec) selenium transferase [Candidatus Bathyarchaeota archaeon]|nr:O-phosphoseryl-tRNA(Sec) selenium transferase [Candidatus Bathyarchaeota archaeon]
MLPFDKLKDTIPKSILDRGLTVLGTESRPIKLLFEQRRVPQEGWKDCQIERFLNLLATMDSDKDSKAAFVGEREGRVVSSAVSKLAGGFHHGVGRSGDLTKAQPKAAGGSLMYFFANILASDAMKRFGVPKIKKAVVFPMATGMTLALVLCATRNLTRGKEVVYPQVDHKTPLKAIQLAGLQERIVEGEIYGDAVNVPTEKIEEAVNENTAAIISTTTFFPPREPDKIKDIAKIAQEKKVPHIINNAFGVQSREIMKLVRGAVDAGRVDAIIQSTDKNFFTPVGGAIVASPNEEFLNHVSETYAGRATAAPVVQFLAAILSIGSEGYEKLRTQQEENRKFLESSLKEVAERHSQRILNVYNPISVAMTLEGRNAKKIGKALYTARVYGSKALEKNDFGVCCPQYISAYINFDASIGIQKNDISLATERLDTVLKTVS